jgi:hypothetical protein
MKIQVLRNVGLADKRRLDTDREDLTEGNVIDCEKAMAEKLIKMGVAVTEADVVKGEAKSPEIKADKK